VSEAWEQLAWIWRMSPRNWKVSAAACLVMLAYLILEIACLF
jgi:hypothetical protein